MGHASIKIDLDDSLMSENWKGPYTEDKRIGAERPLRRPEVMNDSLKHNHCASAAKKTVKTHGNKAVLTDHKGHMTEDNIDGDYKSYLVLYASDVDSASDNNVGGSDIGVDTGYNSHNDEIDEDYKLFCDTYASDVDRASDYNVGGSGIGVGTNYNSHNDEIDEDYKLFFDTYASDVDRACVYNVGGSGIGVDTGYNSHNDEIDEDYKLFFDTYAFDVDSASDNNVGGSDINVNTGCNIDNMKEEEEEEEEEEIDADYQQFLNSHGSFVYKPDKNTAKTSEVEGGSNSSDSDLILIEPNPICEDTPFIFSRVYDSSWFEKETNPGDRRKLYSYDHSQFRRRLMEYLERPYDQKEYDEFLDEVHQKRQTERHVETRHRVVKSYHTQGVNKSYLELYPDLAKAIAEFKEPHRILFLLRGFIFWLKNLCNDGFRPWLDKSCLEILRKM